ncbi:MAG: alpha/beta fold hydrolase [Euryarchaeota archaeon]|nr:alpha/beta fold hydrolase [Euryarchaeota archaeon]
MASIRVGHWIGRIWDTLYDLRDRRVEDLCEVEYVRYGQSTRRRWRGSRKSDLIGVLLHPRGGERTDWVIKINHAWETSGFWYRRKAARLAARYRRPVFLPDFEGHGSSRGFFPLGTSLDPFFPFGLPLSDRYLRDSRDATAHLQKTYGQDVGVVEMGHSNGANTLLQLQHPSIVARIAYAAPIYLPDFRFLGTLDYARHTTTPTLLMDGLLDPATFPLLNQIPIYHSIPPTTPKIAIIIDGGILSSHIDGFCDIYVDLLQAHRRRALVEHYTNSFIDYFVEGKQGALEQLTRRRCGVIDLRHNLDRPGRKAEIKPSGRGSPHPARI